MFKRLFAMFMAVLLLVLGAMSVLAYLSVRGDRIDSRLEAITGEARDIAYLASQDTTTTVGYLLGVDSATMQYLSWKAQKVYDEYGAYILVVDRRGRVMDNMKTAYEQDPDFAESLNTTELSDALLKVIGGQEITVRAMVGGDPTFTVGVPFVQDGAVLGAVLIQTKAQVIEGGVQELLWQVLIVAGFAAMLAAVLVFLYVKSIMRPLTGMARAAGAMAEGDFQVRVDAEKATPEVRELARSFNTMADKLSEVESSRREFVANVSHELRSPITSIRGFVEGMEDGTIPPEEHGKYLAIVGEEIRRLSKLIQDLLALSRLERDDAKLDLKVFDMDEILRRAVIRRVNDLEARHMEVEADFAVDPCPVRADPDRIEQVVVNLLDNAIKFTPAHGHIALRTRVAGETVLVTVQDDGVGILPEDRDKVFDRFFTADRAHTSGKGTGLGLSICKRILEFHGQTIRLEDTKEGAAFTFTLEKGTTEPDKLGA